MIDLSDSYLTADERDLLSERRIAGVCLFGRNIIDRFQVADYVAELRSLAGERLIVAIDQEGGGVVRLRDVPVPPAAMSLGVADDERLTIEVAAAAARGLRAVGVNLDFAPVADVNSNAANPVIADRSFGSDPRLVSRHVAAFVEGLQREGVGATLKHFPGHGDTDVDSHLALPTLRHDLEHLRAIELPPFVAGIAAGAAAVMSAHIYLPALDPKLPATLSRRALHGLLRSQLGFTGVIVTDALDMRAIADSWAAPEAAVLSLAAGADLPLTLGPLREHREVLDTIAAAVREGRLDGEEFALSRRRIADLAERFALAGPDGGLAWRESEADAAVLDEAARRGLLVRGELPRLVAGSEVLLVARESVFTNSAAQVSVRPADTLEEALLAAGIRSRRFSVERLLESSNTAQFSDELASSIAAGSGSEAGAAVPAALIFASTTRVPMVQGEVELARELAERAAAAGRRFVHVALWNPYSADVVPGPALVAFGNGERQARAVVERLLT